MPISLLNHRLRTLTISLGEKYRVSSLGEEGKRLRNCCYGVHGGVDVSTYSPNGPTPRWHKFLSPWWLIYPTLWCRSSISRYFLWFVGLVKQGIYVLRLIGWVGVSESSEPEMKHVQYMQIGSTDLGGSRIRFTWFWGEKKKKSDGWNSETRVQKGKIERDRRAYETHERDSRTGLKRTIRCPNTTLYKNPWKLS